MLISMDILANELREYTVGLRLGGDTGLSISSCRLFDDDIEELQSNCVYIVCDIFKFNMRKVDGFPADSNFIILGKRNLGLDFPSGLNLIFIDGMGPYQAINLVLAIFDKYDSLASQLEDAFNSSAHLQSIVDIATEIIGLPIAMLEMNHCVLAISENLEPEGDKMWEAFKAGYGYQHFSIVDVSQPKLHEMDDKGLDVWEEISNISGRYSRIYLLRKGGRGVASFGLHKLKDFQKPFEKYYVQLADWVVSGITSRLEMFSEVKIGRGKLSEVFLIDLLEGHSISDADLDKMMDVLSISSTSRYCLGMVLSKNEMELTEYDFALMDYIETILSGSKCVEYKSRVLFLYPVEDDDIGQNLALNHDLPHFLQTHACYCFISNVFDSIFDMRTAYEIMLEATKFVAAAERADDSVRLYRYYEFADMHAIEVFGEKIPFRFSENEAVAKLIKHDAENNSEYYHTLEEYLRHFGNTTATAESLHIHRNSLLYRISKIEKIIGCSLEDRVFRQSAMFFVMCSKYLREFGDR